MRRAFLILSLFALYACQDVAPPASGSSDDSDDVDEQRETSSGSPAKDAGSSGKGAPKPNSSDAGKDGGKGSDTGKDGGKGGASSGELPCDVKKVLDQYCGSCHAADEPQFGAPMSLASLADFQATAPTSKTVAYAAAIDRIKRTGKGAMPPSPQPPLPADAKALLLAWLEAKAPAGTKACSSDGPGKTPTVDGGKPTTPPDEPTETDCDVSFELRAHEGEGKKFPIPMEDDHYECFYFKAKVDPGTLATSLAPLLDDTRVLHHWLLFAASNENEAPSGTHRRCNGIHPGAYLMAAWLPGTPTLTLPDDVGMEMPSGTTAQFILENHYNNTARHQNASDNSGVKVCATKKPKAQHAAIHWLGSELITLLPGSTGSATGTCTPASKEPIHILGIIPHMHRLGKHVNMTILRANGSSEVMHNAPFEFENQAIYTKKLVLNPGDRVRTTCDYMNDTNAVVTLGEKTTQEMCYMFTLAYPVGSMNTGGDYRNPLTDQPIIQGPNRCMR
jgi:hypothetical protein